MAKNTRFIAITSGKGGVGKSTMTVNLGMILSYSGLNVMLFDADIGLANLDIMLDVPSELTLLNVLRGECMLEDVIIPVRQNLMLIPGDSGAEIFNYADEGMFERMIAHAGAIDDVDVMLLDTGAGIGTFTQRFLKAADDVIVVTVPDPAALTDAYATIKVTSQYRDHIHMIINQASSPHEAEAIFQRIAQVAANNITPPITLEYLGSVTRDEKVSTAVKRRKNVVVEMPSSMPTRELKRIAAQMMLKIDSQREVRAVESGLAGFFKRLLEQF